MMARDKIGPLSDRDFERDFTDIPDIDRHYRPGFLSDLKGKVSDTVRRARTRKGAKPGDQNSAEFHDELLADKAAEEQVLDETVKRMKGKGLSQDALDLAYGRTKK